MCRGRSLHRPSLVGRDGKKVCEQRDQLGVEEARAANSVHVKNVAEHCRATHAACALREHPQPAGGVAVYVRSSNRERALQKGYQLFWPNASRLFTCPLASMRCHFALWLIILFSVVAIVAAVVLWVVVNNQHAALTTKKHKNHPPHPGSGFLDRVSPDSSAIFFVCFLPHFFWHTHRCFNHDSLDRWRRWGRNPRRGRQVEGFIGSSDPGYRGGAGVLDRSVRRRRGGLQQGDGVRRRQGSRHHSHQPTRRDARYCRRCRCSATDAAAELCSPIQGSSRKIMYSTTQRNGVVIRCGGGRVCIFYFQS